jgi:hypothetical protein
MSKTFDVCLRVSVCVCEMETERKRDIERKVNRRGTKNSLNVIEKFFECDISK